MTPHHVPVISTADTEIGAWRSVVLAATRQTPELLAHLSVVSLRAAAIGELAGLDRGTIDCLAVAGLLHDIGRTPPYRDTGFHPVDGARLASKRGASLACELVAHHTGARYEAEMRGIEIPWPWTPAPAHDALMLADLTTSPDGRVVSLSARRADIEARYARDSIEVRALHRLWDEVLQARAHIDPTGRIVEL